VKLPPRPSRMVVMLFYGTVVAHLGPTLGVFGAARERGLGALASVGLALVFVLLGVGGFVARVWHGLEDRKGEERLVTWFYVPYFVHWCACIFALVPSALFLVVRPIVGLVTGGELLPLVFFSRVYLLGLAVGAYGIYVRRRWTEIRRVEVRVSGLPAAFDGYTIAHLSDLHIGSYTPKSWGKRWAERANALRPDAAVLTGDFVTSGVAFHDDIAEVVGALRATDGVFVSMGNHDYFGDGEPMIGYFRRARCACAPQRGANAHARRCHALPRRDRRHLDPSCRHGRGARRATRGRAVCAPRPRPGGVPRGSEARGRPPALGPHARRPARDPLFGAAYVARHARAPVQRRRLHRGALDALRAPRSRHRVRVP
jgi:hypothetical protein